jgi:hypothetical protein
MCTAEPQSLKETTYLQSKLALFCILVCSPKINKTPYDSAKLVTYFILFMNVDPLAIVQLI